MLKYIKDPTIDMCAHAIKHDPSCASLISKKYLNKKDNVIYLMKTSGIVKEVYVELSTTLKNDKNIQTAALHIDESIND